MDCWPSTDAEVGVAEVGVAEVGVAEVGLPEVGVAGAGLNGAGLNGAGVSDAGVARAPAGRGRFRPGPFRVVIADDADGLRELLCLLFDTEPDFTVVGRATNGAEAVEVVTQTAPDLVLLDVAMPVLDGIGALPHVRMAAPDARVVIFTGFSESALRDEVMALGADELMEKDLSTSALLDRLRQMCRRPRLV
ncbi:response regulator transcription factor [Frankia sp. Mgl5]|uniref:response regulator transcription factor n=1 Tax=Frankia sp. Mgl5 TaxID=2933793 RepID=UPI002010BF1E|nr:response regulator transcription factor [Frankia sp. Mgl5]MCK9925689.1 response regulator transcription factor [Frankia sp. Mgl5]